MILYLKNIDHKTVSVDIAGDGACFTTRFLYTAYFTSADIYYHQRVFHEEKMVLIW